MSATPTERRLAAQKAAHAMHATHDSRRTSEAGRRAFLDRFEREVDPDGTLSPAERARRAEHARRAYFAGLALKSATARRLRREGANSAAGSSSGGEASLASGKTPLPTGGTTVSPAATTNKNGRTVRDSTPGGTPAPTTAAL